MTSCDFQLCDDISCNSYCACGVFYVSLDTFRNIFQFQTTEISNNELPDNALIDINSDITYHVNSSLLPVINAAHSMLDSSYSQGIIYNSNISASNLLKHDYLYYSSFKLFNEARMVSIINNKRDIINSIENNGWIQKNNIETIYSNADNIGNGLVNTNSVIDNKNICKRLLQQIKYYNPYRCIVSNPPQNDRIIDTTSIQSVPLIEGDTINYYFIINNPNIDTRKYIIKLYLTNDTTKINTTPVDSIANTAGYTHITSNGVPQV